MRWLAVVLCAPLMSGCVAELLSDDEQSVRNVACAVLVPERAERWTLVLHPDGIDVSLAVEALVHEVTLAGRSPESVRVVTEDPVEDLEAWAGTRDVLGSDVTTHMAIVSGLDASTLHPIPGVWVLSREAIEQGAEATGRSEAELARILLLHVAGHGLGVVNAGLPMQGPNITGREGPMHHEPRPDSVLSSQWHHVSTMPKSQAAYDRYSDDVRADLAGAPEVCA